MPPRPRRSKDWPDNYFGGRWGPPYALLQGSLQPAGSSVKPARPDFGPGARPVIARGMLAWAAGGGAARASRPRPGLLRHTRRPPGRRPKEPGRGWGAHVTSSLTAASFGGTTGGPDFFVALAQHPEWGTGHTVFAEVVEGDMVRAHKKSRHSNRTAGRVAAPRRRGAAF